MPSFSARSNERLETCHLDLQLLFRAVVEHFDCTIICGHRGMEDQEAAFDAGRSRIRWPHGKHNKTPSLAVDVAPYPIDWKDVRRFDHFAGFVRGMAAQLGIGIRWGGDWDGDMDVRDQRFNDLPHFELLTKASRVT